MVDTNITKSEYTVTNEDLFGGIILTAVAISVLALVVAITGSKDMKVQVDVEDSGSDSRYQAIRNCTPYSATFEQELACYQAVYGGGS